VHARAARRDGDASEALAGYARAVEIWPYRHALNAEAAAYGATVGATVWARDVARTAAVLRPNDVDALRLIAATSLDLGEEDAAREAVARGLVVAPEDPLLLRMQASLVAARPETRQ
jgi:Flp pilus assembly protein TadD